VQFKYGLFSIVTEDLLKDFYDFFTQYGYVIGKIYLNHIDLRNFHIHSKNFIFSNYIAFKSDDIEIEKLIIDN
jgi:hypothetical protein